MNHISSLIFNISRWGECWFLLHFYWISAELILKWTNSRASSSKEFEDIEEPFGFVKAILEHSQEAWWRSAAFDENARGTVVLFVIVSTWKVWRNLDVRRDRLWSTSEVFNLREPFKPSETTFHVIIRYAWRLRMSGCARRIRSLKDVWGVSVNNLLTSQT